MNKQTNPWELLYCNFETSEVAVDSLNHISGADVTWKQKKLPSFFDGSSHLLFCTLCQTVILREGISEHRHRQHADLELTQDETSAIGTRSCKYSRVGSSNPLSISRITLREISFISSPENKRLSTAPVSKNTLDISKNSTPKLQTPEVKQCEGDNSELETMLHECFSSLSKNLGMETTHLTSHEAVEPSDRQNACTTPEVVHQPTSHGSNAFYTNLGTESGTLTTNECNPKDRGFFDFYDFFPENSEFISKCNLDFVDGMAELKTNLTPMREYHPFDVGETRQHDFASSADELRLSPCENDLKDTSVVTNSCRSKITTEIEPTLRDPEPYSGQGKSEASDGQSHMLETPSPDFFTLLSASSSSTYSVDSNVFSGTEASSSETKFDSSFAFQHSKTLNNEDTRSPLSNMPVLVRFSNNNGYRLPGENDVEVEQAVASIVEDVAAMDETDGGSVVPDDIRHDMTAKTVRTSVSTSTPNDNNSSKCLEDPRDVNTMCFTSSADENMHGELLNIQKSPGALSFPIIDCTFPKTCSSSGTLPLLSPVNTTSGIDATTSPSFLETSPLKLADPVGSLAIWSSNLSDVNTTGSQNAAAVGDATDLDSDIWESLELQNYACADADSPEGMSGLKSGDLLTGLEPFLSADSEPSMPQCDFQTSVMTLTEAQGESNQHEQNLMQSTPFPWEASVTLPSDEPSKSTTQNDPKLAKSETNNGKTRRSNEGFNGSLPLHLWPFDPRLHCGVQRDGTVCRRSLLCKLHSMGLKRQVKRPQDISLLVKQLREAKRSKKTSVSKSDTCDTLVERRTTSSTFILPNLSSGILTADCPRSNVEQYTLSEGTLNGTRCLSSQQHTSSTNCIGNLKPATLELTAQQTPTVVRCAAYGNQLQVPAGLLSNATQLRLVDASSQIGEQQVHPQTANYPTSAAGLTVVSDSLQANSVDCKRAFLTNNLSAPYLQFATGQPSAENGIPVSSLLQNRQLCAVIGVAQRRDGQLELQQHVTQPGGFVTVNGMPLSLKMYNQTTTSTSAGLSATRQIHPLLDTGTEFLQQQPSQQPLQQQQQARLSDGQLAANNTATIIVGDRGLNQTAGGAVPLGNIVQYTDDKVDSINLLSPTGATNCISLPPRSARLVQFILPQSATALSFRTHPKYASGSTSVIQLTTTPSAGLEGGTTIPLPQPKPLGEEMVVQQVSQAQQQQPQAVEIFQQLGCSSSAAQPKLQEVSGALQAASENPSAAGTFTVGLQGPSQLQQQQHLRMNGQGVVEMQAVDKNQISIMTAVGETNSQRQQRQQSQLPGAQQITFARNDVPDASSLLTLDEWEQLHKAGSIVLSAPCALTYDSEKNDRLSEPEDLPDSSAVGRTMSLRSSPPALDQQEPLADGLCGSDLVNGAGSVENADQLASSASSTSVNTASATNISATDAQLTFATTGDVSASCSEQQRTSASVGWLDFVNSADLGLPVSGDDFQPHADSTPQASSEEMVDMTSAASKGESTIPPTAKLPGTSASSHSKLRVLLFDMEDEGFEAGSEDQDGRAPEMACCEETTASFNISNFHKASGELEVLAAEENCNGMTAVPSGVEVAPAAELGQRPNEGLGVAPQAGKILRKRATEDCSSLQPCNILYSSSAGNPSIPTAIVAPTAFSLTTTATSQSPSISEETTRSAAVVNAAAAGKLAATPTDKVPQLVNGLVSKLKSPLIQPTTKRRRQSPAGGTNETSSSRGDLAIRVGQETLRLTSPPASKQKRTDDVANGSASMEVLGKSPLSNCAIGPTTVISGKLRSSAEATPTSTALDFHSGKICTISTNQPVSQAGILQLQQASISLPQVPTAGGNSVILYPGCVSINNFSTQTTSVNCQSGIPLASPQINSPVGSTGNVGASPWNCVLKSADSETAASSSSRVPLTLVRLPNGQLAAIPSIASPKTHNQVAFVPQSPLTGTSSMQSQGTQGATLVLRYQQPQPKSDYVVASGGGVRLPSAEQNAIAQIVAQLSANSGNPATVRSALLPVGSNVAIVNGHYQLQQHQQQQQQQQQQLLFQNQQQQQPQQVVMVSGKGMNTCYTGYELGNGITAIRSASAASTAAPPTETEVVSGTSTTGAGATNVVNFPTDLGQPVTSTVAALQREQDVGAHVQTTTATSGYSTATANLISPASRQQSSPMTIMVRSVQSNNTVQLLIPQPDGTMLLQPATSLQNSACYSRLNTHSGNLDCISLLPQQSCHVSGTGGSVGTTVQAGTTATQTTLFGQKACLTGPGNYMLSPVATAMENDGSVAEPSSRAKYTFAMDETVAAGTIFQGTTSLTPTGGPNTTGTHTQVCLSQAGSGMVTLSAAPHTSTAQFVNAGDCDPRGGLPIDEGIQATTAARGGGYIELVTAGPLDVDGGTRSLVSAGGLSGWLSGSNKIPNTENLATTGTSATAPQHILSTIQQPCLDASSLIKVPVSQNRAVVAGNGCGSATTISTSGGNGGSGSASFGSNQQPSQFLFLAPNGASVLSGSAASFGNVTTLVPHTTDHSRSVWTAAQNC